MRDYLGDLLLRSVRPSLAIRPRRRLAYEPALYDAPPREPLELEEIIETEANRDAPASGRAVRQFTPRLRAQ